PVIFLISFVEVAPLFEGVQQNNFSLIPVVTRPATAARARGGCLLWHWLRRGRERGRPVAASSYGRRDELSSIEAEARPNHWAVFTFGCRAILAPTTYSFQIGFGLAIQGIDREPLPSLRSDGF